VRKVLRHEKTASDGLAVVSQHVVPGERDAADGWSAAQAAVRAVPIVVMEPEWQSVCSLTRVTIDAAVGPFAQRGLNESLGLPVCLGPIEPRVQPLDLMFLTDGYKRLGIKDLAVVSHDAFDTQSQAVVIRQSMAQEPGRAFGVLRWPHFGEPDSRVIVHRNVSHIPSNPPSSLLAISGDAMPDDSDGAQALDVQVQQLARSGALVAPRYDRRFQVAQPTQPDTGARTRDTVALEIRKVIAMVAIVRRCRRNVTTRCAVPLAIAVGDRFGRELRSCNATSPPAR